MSQNHIVNKKTQLTIGNRAAAAGKKSTVSQCKEHNLEKYIQWVTVQRCRWQYVHSFAVVSSKFSENLN